MEENCKRMSSPGGDGGDEGGWGANHFRSQFRIVIQKHCIENISRREGAAVGRYVIIEEKRSIQKIMKLRLDFRSGPSKFKKIFGAVD
jgi:hypothetical protein